MDVVSKQDIQQCAMRRLIRKARYHLLEVINVAFPKTLGVPR